MLLHTERITLNREHQVSMTAMLWKENSSAANSFKRPSVLIFPGGGDVELSDREAENVAFPYLTAGFHAFVLYYSILEHRRWPNALDDYDQAITYIRSHSEEWNLLPDKIAVIGFSAGAHHAACAATMSENRPNAAILGYAPLEEGILSIAHPGEDFPAPVDHVDDCTPPCFLFSARDDRLVDVHNQVSFESALIDHGISFESHIYAYGGHGFATGSEAILEQPLCSRGKRWIQDSVEWLQDMFGLISACGISEPACPARVNADHEDFLSINCTIEHLQKHGPEVLASLDGLFRAIENAGQALLHSESDLSVLHALKSSRLSDLLMITGQPQDVMDRLDKMLNRIPNTRLS